MTTILAGLVLLGVLVFVHELGHFLVAKACGVRVLTFSLGFGPRLFGFKKGETDYRVSAIPLGGYVRMYGDDVTEEIPEEERDKSFLHKPTLQKSAIAFAGPLANFILPLFLFFFLFVGEEQTASTLVGTVVPEDPAADAGLLPGDRILSVDGKGIETFREVQQHVEERVGREVTFVVERNGEHITIALTPRGSPSLNPLEKGELKGRVGIMPHVQLPFVHVMPESPAARAGVKTLDRVESIDGIAVGSRAELLALLDERAGKSVSLVVAVQPLAKKGAAPETRTVILAPDEVIPPFDPTVDRFGVLDDEAAAGELRATLDETRALLAAEWTATARRFGLSSYEGTFERVEAQTPAAELAVDEGDRAAVVDGRRVHVGSEVSTRLYGRPDDVHVIGLLDDDGRARLLVFRLTPEKERGREDFKTFGALPGSGAYTDGEVITRDVGLGEALVRAGSETREMISMTAKSLWMLATLQVSFSSLGGPITIVDLAGQAAERGVKSFVTLMAFISVNLGIINLLPVPVLDGGHLLMFGIEAVSRQRLNPKTRERAVKVGFAMLLCLVVVALFNDVLRLL